MNQSTDFTLVSYCVTRHLARSERAAMAKRCLAAVCFALRLLRPSLVVMGMRSSGAFNNDGVAWLPTSPHLVDAMVARLFAGNFSFYRTFPPGARTTFKDQDLFAYHLTHTPGCAFVDLGPCAFWRAKGKRRCREGAPLMIHTTWWFKAIGVIERAVGSLAAGSCASLPPRLSSEEVEQLCTHSPADQSEICRRIAH